MNKEQFFLMRSEEISQLYPADFTKKEAQKTGVKLVTDLLESGEIDKMQFAANLARLNEVISTAMAEIRNHLPNEKQTVLGVEFNPRSGGESINYKDDPVYAELQKQLKEREELLKVALKLDIEMYDSEGILIPKVSTSPRKSSLSISF